MNLRTKISVGAIISSVLYLIITLVGGGAAEAKSAANTTLQSSPQETVLDLQVQDLEKNYCEERDCILERVKKAVSSDFRKYENYKKTQPIQGPSNTQPANPDNSNVVPTPEIAVTYSSFLACGNENCAVLNGVTTPVGKKVFNTNLTVSKIEPDFVELTAPDGHEYKIKFKQDKK